MKKALAILLTAILTAAGLWFALVAQFDNLHPFSQGGKAILSAVLFSLALLAAGWGNSLKWKRND